MISRSLQSRDFRRILLIKPSALGDVIHALPILVKLRRRYPDARIDWLVTPENAELVRDHPALTEAVLFARREYGRFGRSWSATVGLIGLLHTLWARKYDLVVDLHGQLRSAMFTLATGAAVRVGFQVCREGAWMAYSHHIPVPTLDVHAVDRYLWLTPILGLDDDPPDFRIHLPASAEGQVDRLLGGALDSAEGGRLAVLVPGTVWQTKHWRPSGFAEVGRRLAADGWTVVLAGAPGERVRCREVAAACPGALDLSGQTTLAGLAVLIRRAGLCVTNDSGSMHLAVAMGRPVVSVFGPTDPGRTGPYRRPEGVVRAAPPCSPCFFRSLRQCGHSHACMEQVTPDMVMERIAAISSSSNRRVPAAVGA